MVLIPYNECEHRELVKYMGTYTHKLKSTSESKFSEIFEDK